MKAIRMLSAAFPRAAWKQDSEAVYTMALGQAGVAPSIARRAIARLITEETELPPVSLILKRCRETVAADYFRDLRCPACASSLVAGTIGGLAVCFDCDWEGELPYSSGEGTACSA